MAEDGHAQPDVGTYAAFQALVERAYAYNGGAKVVVAAHSLGNLVTLSALHSLGDAWTKQYVKRYVAVAPPIGGAVGVLGSTLSGEIGGIISALPRDIEYNLGLSQASPLWLAAYSEAFGGAPLISTPTRNYTAADVCGVLTATANPGAAFCDAAHNFAPRHASRPLPVPTACLYGTGVPTPARYVYGAELATGVQPKALSIELGLGDGIVNAASLELCRTTLGGTATPLFNVTHADIVQKPAGIAAVLAAVLAP